MRILVTSAGSDGDVVPYLALARALRDAGHDAYVYLADFYEGKARAAGVPFRTGRPPWDEGKVRALMAEILAARNPLRQVALVFQRMAPEMAEALPDLLEAARDVDLIVTHTVAIGGAIVAEKLGKPWAMGHLQPGVRATRTASPVGSDLGGPLNAALWWLAGLFIRRLTDPPINDVRRAAGLAPGRDLLLGGAHSPRLNLMAFSRHVFARDPAWPRHYVQTGYWFPGGTGWAPDEALRAFMEDGGAPPVVVTFGSMHELDAQALTDLVVDAVLSIGRRAVLQTGWGGLGKAKLPDAIRRLDGFVDHGWLFARAACVVHHGGAGTTAATLRAGVPPVVCWLLADQPAWGRLVWRLGAGPAPLAFRGLSARRLGATLRRVLDDAAMQGRARALGEKIRAEDGVRAAVRAIEETFA
ncbi:MAG TPA: glycosyltransferase [Myxococcota bacterium]|nr:glycosyltransferase [Myxococcota bacterium]